MKYFPLNHATRQEMELELEVVEGQLPEDLHGYVFVNSPAGTVNHPTPAPPQWPDGSTCQEHGASILNGDGMLYRFDFSQTGKAKMKNRLLKSLCYFADEATRYGSSHYQNGLHYTSLGVARAHKDLGTRNQLNTALSQVRFKPEGPAHLVANFDAGRHYLIDPVSMKALTPIGKQQEWLRAHPDAMEEVFPIVHATAHPSYDPLTREFFSVCFQKSLTNQIFNTEINHRLKKASDFVIRELEQFTEWLTGKDLTPEQLADSIRSFIPFLSEKHAAGHKKEFKDHYKVYNTPITKSEVRVMRWTGGKLNSWRVVDASTGVPISITQTMHQTGVTEDYIIVCDTTLKFAMDMLQSLPFGHHHKLNDLLRKITTHCIKPHTPCYVISRSDLIEDREDVKARRFDLDIEMIHFSLNYRNPAGKITMHSAHNTAACGGEWVRPYDQLATRPGEKVPEDHIGLMAASSLDIGRIGKHLIDGEKGRILHSEYICDKGFDGDSPSDITRPHTWGIGLYTFRNNLDSSKPVENIRQVYYQFYGLAETELTSFIYDLYKDYNKEGREISGEDMLRYYRQGIPASLCRQDTEKMSLEDCYFFGAHEIMRSLEFVPRSPSKTTKPERNPDSDAYILCLMHVRDKEDTKAENGYRRMLYLFDAAELSSGPVCKLSHPDLAFGFTIHSIFFPEIEKPDTAYRVDLKEDYHWVISRFPDEEKRKKMLEFMDRDVYPRFVDYTGETSGAKSEA